MLHNALRQVKAAIRQPYAWPGGYPVYTVCTDGTLLCRECAREHYRLIVADAKGYNYMGSWGVLGAEILWEGREFCGHCLKELESAYGVPEED